MPYKARKKGEINKMSDMNIISCVQGKLALDNKKLSNAQCRFLLRLIDYACTYGLESEDKRGYVIFLSEEEMVEKFALSKSMVTKCLGIYREAGIIERIKSSTDPRCSNTLILSQYYVQ